MWMGSRGADIVHSMQRTTRITLKYVRGCNVTVRQRPQRCRVWELGSEAQALLPNMYTTTLFVPSKSLYYLCFFTKFFTRCITSHESEWLHKYSVIFYTAVDVMFSSKSLSFQNAPFTVHTCHHQEISTKFHFCDHGYISMQNNLLSTKRTCNAGCTTPTYAT